MKKSDVVLITPDDEVIGTIDKISAHRYAMLHRAFSIFIYRMIHGQVEILLQQRQIDKYHSGGLWTNTCCSHPALNQDLIEAARQRLKEEMGISAELKLIGRFHYVASFANSLFENELDYVLVGTFDEGKIPFNLKEVQAVKWVSLDNLLILIKKEPERFTPWLTKGLELFINYCNK